MKKSVTTVHYNGLDFLLIGYFHPSSTSTYVFNDGGAPDYPASFEMTEVMINDVNVMEMLNDSILDELCELGLKNLK